MKHPVKPFLIFAQLSFHSEEKLAIDLEGWKGVADFESKQDQCGSYVALQPIEGDKTAVTVLEAYDSQEYLMNDHRNSDAFQKLRAASAKAETRVGAPEIITFKPVGGWLWRDDVPRLALGDQFIWIARFKSHPGKRDELLKSTLTHTDNVHRTEGDTYSFLVLENTQDEDSLVIFERYVSEEYFKTVHATSESMQQFRANIKDNLAERVAGGYRAVRGFVDKREALA